MIECVAAAGLSSSTSRASTTGQGSNNTTTKVYTDENSATGQQQVPAPTHEWATAPIGKTNKENEQKPTVWTGAKVR